MKPTAFIHHPYARLIRLDKPTGNLLLMWPCFWGVLASSTTPEPALLLLFALGAFAMRSAGCVINDITDRDIDAQVSRTAQRPLASGAITTNEVLTILAILLAVALAVALALGAKVLLLGLCWLPLVVLYPRMKRLTWWPQAFLGLTFGAGPLFGELAATGTITLTGVLLYLGAICLVIGYDTIYACQDITDDEAIGVKSTARLFGSGIRRWVGLFYALGVSLIAAAYLREYPLLSHGVMFLLSAVLWLVWQVVSLDPQDTHRCLRQFKAHRLIGGVIALAFAV